MNPNGPHRPKLMTSTFGSILKKISVETGPII
jgi:hypothetical protein